MKLDCIRDIIAKHSISGIAFHTDNIKRNFAFFLLPSQHNDESKQDIVDSAIHKGASCIVTSDEIYDLRIAIYRTDRASIYSHASAIAHILSGQYVKNIIAITGTNGKTTLSNIIYNCINQFTDAVSYIGTLGVLPNRFNSLFDGQQANTTPEQPYLYSALQEMKINGIDYCVMEASSYGLRCNRLDNIVPKVAILTNCHSDHIELHDNLNGYIESKKTLFTKCIDRNGCAIFNIDNHNSSDFFHACIASTKLTFSLFNKNSDAFIVSHSDRQCVVSIMKQEYTIQLSSLSVRYQLYNVLATLLTIKYLGYDIRKIKTMDMSIKGRMEIKKYKSNYVIVDYAHNPASVFGILANFANRRITTITGAGGERDKYKRAPISRLCYALSDRFIITDDNYRKEDPALIRHQMNCVAPDAINIPGRFEAISYAVNTLSRNEILLLLGKGHEQYIDGMGLKIPMNDMEFVDFCFTRRKLK